VGRYKHASRTFVLEFDDMPGLEVRLRPVSVSQLMDLAGLADEFAAGKATPGQVSELFETFADRLVSWNLDIDDEEVPADIKGVRSLDADLFMKMLSGWFAGMTQAPKSSPAEMDLPMEPLR